MTREPEDERRRERIAAALGDDVLIDESQVEVVVANGTIITGGAVSHSVLCPQVRVHDSASVERCILFDDVTVGEGAELRNCIIDKHARIPPGTRIGFDARADAERFEVTPRGVVVVPKAYPSAAGDDASRG